MNISSTNHLFNTIAQLHMPDDERATLQAAITSSLAQLATPIPVPHKPQKPTSYNGKVDAISSLNFIESLEEYFQIVELPATIRQADLERCVFVLYVFIERRRVCRETGSRRTGEGISRIAD